MTEEKVTTKRIALAAFLMIVCLALPTFAQRSKTVTKGPVVIKEFKHDTGPALREVAPLLPEFSTPSEHEIENNVNPNHKWSNQVQKDPVLQTEENSPRLQTPNFGVEFDGAGFGDNFFCDCMPPDNDGAAGLTQYVQYINLEYQVFDKSGNTVLGPLSGNSFWSGFGGSCQSDNSGDPVIRFDAAAQRWIVAQFAINNSGADFECVAVSTTPDATGSYNRYAFSFNDFPDYPKVGVWPDGYYFTFNNFNLSGTAFVGANVCAADRSKMLTGAAATIQCFQRGNNEFGMLPSDLDGATPPAAGTPNFVMELDPTGASNLYMYNFHVDFTTPANSTFTGPTVIPVGAFTPLCNSQSRGACVPQPTAGSDLLESLGDRLMWRLVYRNFGDHTTLLTTHSIVAGNSGGVRWYEIRNPETTPTVFQSGTFAPDSQWRFMPAIAMDQSEDIALGYTVSGAGAGQFPSLVYAGRTPADPAGTLESEVVLKAGAGSQSSGFNRWGDYSSVTVDPTDDCTFWFTEEYEKVTGGFNWNTAIGSFKFPGCTGTPNFILGASPNALTVLQGGSGTSTVTVTDLNGFSGSVNLAASGLPSGVTAKLSPNPTSTTSTLTLTASATAALGTSTITITGTSWSLTSITTLTLKIVGPDFSLTATPNTLTVPPGSSGTSTIAVVPVNGFAGSVTLAASGVPSGVTAGFSPNPTTSSSTLTLTVSASAGAGTKTITITGTSGSVSHTTTVVLKIKGAKVKLVPTSLVWGKTLVGHNASVKTVTLTNSGNATLNISTIAVSGDFFQKVVTGSCVSGSTVLAGKSCTIKVNFLPTQVGLRTGAVTITDNAAGSPQTVALSGTGK
jgi:hypothetical protein